MARMNCYGVLTLIFQKASRTRFILDSLAPVPHFRLVPGLYGILRWALKGIGNQVLHKLKALVVETGILWSKYSASIA